MARWKVCACQKRACHEACMLNAVRLIKLQIRDKEKPKTKKEVAEKKGAEYKQYLAARLRNLIASP